MTFEDFAKKEHAKRVAHFVRYIDAHKHKPTIEECIEIFGFCERDARPIYNDAVAVVAPRQK